MAKQINIKMTSSETELQEWLDAQNSASGSVKLLIRQAIARYGNHIDIADALIQESLTRTTVSQKDITQLKT